MYMGKLGNCKAEETPAAAADHDQVIVTAEGVLRYALVCVAAVTLLVGVWSCSFRKMVAVYFVSMVLVGGVVLPDWDYFDRDWKEWCTPMPGVQSGNTIIPPRPFRSAGHRNH